jgi:GNAT superfamily N-acetyltransferase
MPNSSRRIQIVTTADRPDLDHTVARWLWEAFWDDDGYSFDETLRAVHQSITAHFLPRTFILLLNGVPVGTASLAEHDLDERPDLGPWLAGVFIVPEARGQGLAAHLIATVEAACRIAGIRTLWLYTLSADRIYTRAGWCAVERPLHNGKQVTLMRRDLTEPTETQVI